MASQESILVRDVLERILERHDRYSTRLNAPGDWGERAFRGWLAIELFHQILAWEPSQIVFGEQFDLLLVDANLHPVVNIETKSPTHKPSARDATDFKKRLGVYATLRYACLTNGWTWTRLQLAAPRGRQTIQGSCGLDIRRSSQAQIQKFFQPLWARDYLKPGQ